MKMFSSKEETSISQHYVFKEYHITFKHDFVIDMYIWYHLDNIPLQHDIVLYLCYGSDIFGNGIH